MEEIRYSDALRRLAGFDDWLRGLGITPRRDDRIHRAFSVLREGEDASVRGKLTGEYSNIEALQLFPLVESLEADEVLCAFKSESSLELSNALKRALSGPAQLRDENNGANRDGRNVWFELVLAAEWKLRGASVRLGEPDLRLSRDGSTFLVACKRPAGGNSIRSNIRGAIVQLNENLKKEQQGTFGVVALSVSRVWNPGDKYWSGNPDSLGKRLEALMSEHRRDWQCAELNPRICSILFHIATPSDPPKGADLRLLRFSMVERIQECPGAKLFEAHINAMRSGR